MIHVHFNDELIFLDDNYSLAEFLIQKNYTKDYFAVAVNRQFIARSQYSVTFLKDEDVIDLISPMQGG